MSDNLNYYFFQVMLTASDYSYRMKEESLDVVTIYDNQIETVLIRKLKDKYPSHK